MSQASPHHALAVALAAAFTLPAAMPGLAQAPPDDFAGHWRGVGTQMLGGELQTFVTDFDIASGGEDSLYLINSFIEDGGTHAYMVGEGRLLGDGSFRFRETEIVRDTTRPNFSWCLKRATLDVAVDEYGDLVMSGVVYARTVEGGECPPGDFVMRKTVVRP